MNPVLLSTAVAQAGLGYYNFIHKPSSRALKSATLSEDINRVAFINEATAFKSVEGVSIEEGILNCKTLAVNNKKLPTSLKRRYSALLSNEEEVVESEDVLAVNGELICKGIDVDNVKLGKDLIASNDGFLTVESGKVVTKIVASTDPKRVFVNDIKSNVRSMVIFGNVGARSIRNSEIRIDLVTQTQPNLIEFIRNLNGEMILNNGFPLFAINTKPESETWFLTGRAEDSISVKFSSRDKGLVRVKSKENDNLLTLGTVLNNVEIPKTTDPSPVVSSNVSDKFVSRKWDLTTNLKENVHLVYKTEGSIGFSATPLSGATIVKNQLLIKPNSATTVGFIDNKIQSSWILDPFVDGSDDNLVGIGPNKTIINSPYYLTYDKKNYVFNRHLLTFSDDKILTPFVFPPIENILSDDVSRVIFRHNGNVHFSTQIPIDPTADYSPGTKNYLTTPSITRGKLDNVNNIQHDKDSLCIIGEAIRLKDCLFDGTRPDNNVPEMLGIYEDSGALKIGAMFNPFFNTIDFGGEITSISRLLTIKPNRRLAAESVRYMPIPMFGGPFVSCVLFRSRENVTAELEQGGGEHFVHLVQGSVEEGFDESNMDQQAFVATNWCIESDNDVNLVIEISVEREGHEHSYLFPVTKGKKHYCSTFNYVRVKNNFFPTFKMKSLKEHPNPLVITFSHFTEIRFH